MTDQPIEISAHASLNDIPPADWDACAAPEGATGGNIARQAALCLDAAIKDRSKVGLYNLAPAGSTDWCEFAREIISQGLAQGVELALTPTDIHPISSAEYPTPALRPANSLLDTWKLQKTFGLQPDDWKMLYRESVKTS